MNITTYENALKTLRQLILDYTNLPNEFVLNGDSIYGPDAWKMISELIGESPTLTDTFIVFEFKEIPNDSFGITDYDINNMFGIAPYGLFLKIYGDYCHSVAYKLAALFKYPAAIENLYANGIKIINTSQINSLNEFINNVRWPRCDIEIDVLCNFKINLISHEDSGIAESITQPVNIIKV